MNFSDDETCSRTIGFYWHFCRLISSRRESSHLTTPPPQPNAVPLGHKKAMNANTIFESSDYIRYALRYHYGNAYLMLLEPLRRFSLALVVLRREVLLSIYRYRRSYHYLISADFWA